MAAPVAGAKAVAVEAAGEGGRGAEEEEEEEVGKAKGVRRRRQVRRRKDAAVSANVAHTNYEIVRAVVEELGFEVEADGGALGCNLLWFDGSPPGEVFARLEAYQRVNHFPNTGQITRKDCLARNLNRVQRACGAEQRFDFYPRSWVLPSDAQALRRFDDAQREAGRHPTYILKPPNGARGVGIGLAKSLAKVPEGEPLLVQEYLSRPYLIEGKKFDLRLYVLVSACDPLRVFLHGDGLVRMSTEDYTAPTSKNLHNMFVHLTNYSVNKHSEGFEQTDDPSTGSKRSYKWLLGHLREAGEDVERLCRRINDVILKTLIVALPHLFEGHDACRRQSEAGQHRAPLNLVDAALQASPLSRSTAPRPSLCFEILGFDVYLSKKLKPYILEVNRAPSFTCDSSLDTEIKHDVLTSALRLLHLKAGDRNRAQLRAKESSLKRLVRDPDGVAALAQDVATLAVNAAGPPPSESATAFRHWHEEQLRKEAGRRGGYSLIFPCFEDEVGLERYHRLIQIAFEVYTAAKGTSATTVSAGQARRQRAVGSSGPEPALQRKSSHGPRGAQGSPIAGRPPGPPPSAGLTGPARMVGGDRAASAAVAGHGRRAPTKAEAASAPGRPGQSGVQRCWASVRHPAGGADVPLVAQPAATPNAATALASLSALLASPRDQEPALGEGDAGSPACTTKAAAAAEGRGVRSFFFSELSPVDRRRLLSASRDRALEKLGEGPYRGLAERVYAQLVEGDDQYVWATLLAPTALGDPGRSLRLLGLGEADSGDQQWRAGAGEEDMGRVAQALLLVAQDDILRATMGYAREGNAAVDPTVQRPRPALHSLRNAGSGHKQQAASTAATATVEFRERPMFSLIQAQPPPPPVVRQGSGHRPVAAVPMQTLVLAAPAGRGPVRRGAMPL